MCKHVLQLLEQLRSPDLVLGVHLWRSVPGHVYTRQGKRKAALVAAGVLASGFKYLKKAGVKLRATQLIVSLWLLPVCLDTDAGGDAALTVVVTHD